MKRLLTTTTIALFAATGASAQLVAPDASEGRAAGALAVEQEGSGMTTMSSPNVDTVRGNEQSSATLDGPAGDGEFEGTTTNVPNLDDGTVVDNRKTPATVVIVDGRAQATTGDVAMDGDATATNNIALRDIDVGAAPGYFDAPVTAPDVSAVGYAPVAIDALTPPEMAGATVLSTDSDPVGEISAVIMNERERPVGAVLDRGMGEDAVMVPLGALTALQGPSGAIFVMDAAAMDAMMPYGG
jgi:hypothetical protein